MTKERSKGHEISSSHWKSGNLAAQRGEPMSLTLVNKTIAMRDYIQGYSKELTDQLNFYRIDPVKLGIEVDIDHLFLRDHDFNDFFGVKGFNEGLQMQKFKDVAVDELGLSPENHYKDGYALGLVLAELNILNGKFAAFRDENEFDKELKPLFVSFAKEWLDSIKPNEFFDPEIVFNFSYYPRLAFAYVMNNGNKDLDEYKKYIKGKAIKTLDSSAVDIDKVLDGINRAAILAMNLKNDFGFIYNKQPEVIGVRGAYEERLRRMREKKLRKKS